VQALQKYRAKRESTDRAGYNRIKHGSRDRILFRSLCRNRRELWQIHYTSKQKNTPHLGLRTKSIVIRAGQHFYDRPIDPCDCQFVSHVARGGGVVRIVCCVVLFFATISGAYAQSAKHAPVRAPADVLEPGVKARTAIRHNVAAGSISSLGILKRFEASV